MLMSEIKLLLNCGIFFNAKINLFRHVGSSNLILFMTLIFYIHTNDSESKEKKMLCLFIN